MRGKKWLAMLISATIGLSTVCATTGMSVIAADENSSNSIEATPLVQAARSVSMYRLYNPNSGEHFYTANAGERDSLTRAGWNYEGIGWTAPASGNPVYRLYNPNSGDHHYTTSAGERDSLKKAGWRYEGIGWRSGGSVPIYRQYNPHARAGSHNYTTSASERDQLIHAGWRNEGVGWYGTGVGKAADVGVNYSLYRSTVTSIRGDLSRTAIGEETSRYTLWDINGDGIKELFVDYHPGEAAAMLYIYTIQNGKVRKLSEIGFGQSSITGTSGRSIIYEGGHMGYYFISRLRWDGRKIVNETISTISDSGNHFVTDSEMDSWTNNTHRSIGYKGIEEYHISDYSHLK